MKKRILIVLPVLFFALSGCYHAKVMTGKEPGTTVIDTPWAKGFVYGLVPPDELDVSEECPNGVAIVETQHSFLNMVAQALTFGIFSPMHITVTCAAGSMSAVDAPQIDVASDASTEEVAAAVREAANISLYTHDQVKINFLP